MSILCFHLCFRRIQSLSLPECSITLTVYPSLHVTMWILFLRIPSGCNFIRLLSITWIHNEISSCEMWIFSVLFSSCSAAFEESFDDWKMILSYPLLTTFIRTKTLALPPILPGLWQLATRELYFYEKGLWASDWVIRVTLPWICLWTLMMVHLTI